LVNEDNFDENVGNSGDGDIAVVHENEIAGRKRRRSSSPLSENSDDDLDNVNDS
jgi:hypothetical protein